MAKRNRTSRERQLEDWMFKQIERYVKIHKEHEKDLRYIG